MDKVIDYKNLILSFISLTISILAFAISLFNYWKDNRIKLAVHFEPCYYVKDSENKNFIIQARNKSKINKNVIIQAYNKSKIGEAFRFNGIYFSRCKNKCLLQIHRILIERILKKKIEMLNDNVLKTGENKKDFEIIEPFQMGKRRSIERNFFVNRVVDFINENESIKKRILKSKKGVSLIIKYEESLGKVNLFRVRLTSEGEHSDLYNDILKQLEIINKTNTTEE